MSIKEIKNNRIILLRIIKIIIIHNKIKYKMYFKAKMIFPIFKIIWEIQLQTLTLIIIVSFLKEIFQINAKTK